MIGLVTASLVTITVDFRGGDSGPLAAAGRAALGIISPLQNAVSRVFRPVGDFVSTITHLGSLRAEIRQLETQLAEQQQQSGSYWTLLARTHQLEELMRFKQRYGRGIGADVIAEGVSNFEWTITVNAGSDGGVKVNDPVIAPEGLAGHVVEVSGSSSVVQLIIDPDSGVGARLSISRETGLLVGSREDEMRLELLDPAVDVEPGEPVETSGLEGGRYPGGIPIGVVSRVLEDPSALSKEVWVRPNLDVSRLEIVVILLTH